MPQQDHRNDRREDGDDRACDADNLESLHEGLAAGVEQRHADLRREGFRYGKRAAERVARSLGGLRRNVAGTASAILLAVDRGADAAEDGDAERTAELGARLRDGGGRAGALRRSGADDQVGGEREDRRDAERDDEGGRATTTASPLRRSASVNSAKPHAATRRPALIT